MERRQSVGAAPGFFTLHREGLGWDGTGWMDGWAEGWMESASWLEHLAANSSREFSRPSWCCCVFGCCDAGDGWLVAWRLRVWLVSSGLGSGVRKLRSHDHGVGGWVNVWMWEVLGWSRAWVLLLGGGVGGICT